MTIGASYTAPWDSITMTATSFGKHGTGLVRQVDSLATSPAAYYLFTEQVQTLAATLSGGG